MMQTAHYCTYFDERYLTRGLALHASMRRHCAPFRLWVLCMSDECHRQLSLLNLPEIVPLKLGDLETHFPALLVAKSDRSLLEYYFTCTPALLAWLFDTQPAIDILIYLDSDLYFFSRPDFLFEEFADFSVSIVPHRFSPRNAHHVRWGIYNVGWVGFRRDAEGMRCLAWWRDRCLEWCRDIEEPDRFADQKYLDAFPKLFAGVQVIQHPGVNLAPWNLDHSPLSKSASGEIEVDGKPIVFFHFHRLRRVTGYLWQTPHIEFGAPLDGMVRRSLYAPYFADLTGAEKLIDITPNISVLRRDNLRIGSLAGKLRSIAAVIWRGGGVWTFAGRVV